MIIKNIVLLIVFLIGELISQNLQIEKVEPPNWWVGMKYDQVQLMIYGSGLTNIQSQFDADGLKINKIHQIKNGSYAFIDVQVSPNIEPGTYKLKISNGQTESTIDFPILVRDENNFIHQGFNPADIIYLITPDRFVNGDPDNDFRSEMRDKFQSDDILGRHGGDIQGIIDKLDYLSDLGITTIWINPLVENDMDISYHGYGATDFYKIDPRFGTNEDYKKLVHLAHMKGLKVIKDHVANHIGKYHPWMFNMPSEDWINGSINNHLNNTHKKEVLTDIHGDSLTSINIQQGWFVDEMPDLNQKNSFVANYIIQNTLWWIEYAGIDGIREDTYPYADPEFMSKWAEIIIREYPKFNIVGEIWIHDPPILSTYQSGSFFPKDFDSYLPTLTDFGLFEAFGRVFNRGKSIDEIYRFLSLDFLYPDPYGLMIFLDNHDVMRAIDLVGGDVKRLKMALQILLTTRGVPQIYYGTEIGLSGGEDHGEIRRNFPGGFPNDKRNAFEETGRTREENEIWYFLKILIDMRKSYKALSLGKLIHFPVVDEFYLYIRTYKNESILIIVNNKSEDRDIDLTFLETILSSDNTLKNLKSGEIFNPTLQKKITIPGYDLGIYQIN